VSKQGASVTAVDKQGRQLIHLAADKGYLRVMDYLLGELAEQKVSATAEDKQGWQPIHYAAENNHIGMVDHLVQGHHVSLDSTDSENKTLLHRSVEKKNQKMTQFLLEQKANVNAVENRSGSTPLHLAAKNRDLKTLELLIDAGADPSLPDGVGRTALYHAYNENFIDVVDLLLEKKADPNLVVDTKTGSTLLHLAAAKGDTDMIVKLHKAGALLDVRDSNEKTAHNLALNDQTRDRLNSLAPEPANPDCSICFEPMVDLKNLAMVIETKCNHYFHKGCLDDWRKKKNTCPLCVGKL
jgi:ankyrin repeat protein